MIIELTEREIAEVQRYFDFAWEHTVYRANLQALRGALHLQNVISLPCDAALQETLEALCMDPALAPETSAAIKTVLNKSFGPKVDQAESAGPHPDWSDPDNAPPAFEGTVPHAFKPSESLLLPCCVSCGGGKKHPIHV